MVLDAVSGLFDSGGPPGVRRPKLELDFGGNADSWLQQVTVVQFEAGLVPAVDAVHIQLSSTTEAPPVAPGDTGQVALGYEDSGTTTVFTGQVMSVERSLNGPIVVTATNGGSVLSGMRVNRSYDQLKAGEIVSDLASEIETGSIEDGLLFPYYVVDSSRSAIQHVGVLARKCNFVAYFTPEGKLDFVPYSPGSPVQTFTYAVDILALDISEAIPGTGLVTLIGDGAAGSGGAWNWLVKDPTSVTGTAGTGSPERLRSDASLRSSDAARTAAEGEANAAGLMRVVGELTVPGAPAVTVGSVIEIAAAPQDTLNGQCFVRRVRHTYSKQRGFITRIAFSHIGAGGGGLLGGLL